MSDNPTTTMPHRLDPHNANITVEVGAGNSQDTSRATINHQVGGVVVDLETTYRTRDNSRVHNSVYIGQNIHAVVIDSNVSDQDAAVIQQGIERAITELQTQADNRVRNTNRGNAATPLARPAIYSTAARLMGFLPSVSLDALPDDSKECIVCHERYAGQDTPVMLQCNHVVGRECIGNWILGGHHTCPVCRQAMFEPDEGTVVVD